MREAISLMREAISGEREPDDERREHLMSGAIHGDQCRTDATGGYPRQRRVAIRGWPSTFWPAEHRPRMSSCVSPFFITTR